MTMKRSLAAVRAALGDLTNVVRELELAVGDGPAGDDGPAVVEALRAQAAEVEGDVTETATAIVAAVDADEAGDSSRSARALADAHERFNGATRRVRFTLAGHGNLFELEHLGSRRGGAWRGWSEVVLRQLERVDHAVHRAHAAFIGCWQEIAERAIASAR